MLLPPKNQLNSTQKRAFSKKNGGKIWRYQKEAVLLRRSNLIALAECKDTAPQGVFFMLRSISKHYAVLPRGVAVIAHQTNAKGLNSG